MLLLKHTLQQLLNMNTAGEDGPGPSSGSAVPLSSGWLLREPPWAAGENVTGVYLCPLPGRAVQQRTVKAEEMLDVLLSMSSLL